MNLGLNKENFNNIDKRLETITKQEVEQIEINTELPPTTNNLTDSNKTYAIDAAILFVDIRKSTDLTDTSKMKSMVKVYRSFMRAVVACVRFNGGVTRQFLGDRIMGVFTDEKDENGNIISAVDKAISCARSIQTVIDFSLNKHLKNNVNNKTIECGIGIDYGRVLVSKIGMYGVEENEQKENETDCVWVGKTTNYASKYSDLAEGGQIFVSENVYNNISNDMKTINIWKPTIKTKSNKYFKGYTANDFYLNIINELGEPIKPEKFLDSSENDSNIQNMYNNVLKKTKELTKLETELKDKEIKLKEEQANINSKESNYKNNVEELYYKVGGYLEYAFCKSEYIEKMGIDFWKKCIEMTYELGETLSYSKTQIKSRFACYLIDIYDYFEMYDEAYEVMVVMAQENGHWVYTKRNTILWAKKNYIIFKIKDAINERLEDYSTYIDREDYRKRLEEIEKICNGG